MEFSRGAGNVGLTGIGLLSMKTFGTAAAIGLIIALVLIYLLRPLNAGAIALVCLLSVAVAELLCSAVVLVLKLCRNPNQ